jgi:NAD(P)-dependent dehydrogenase (short-subunit alcohol dehydrogenase family)
VDQNSFQSKEVLILGGSSSLAERVIPDLLKEGCGITATSRQPQVSKTPGLAWLQLDISNSTSIESFISAIAQKEFDVILFFVGAPSKVSKSKSEYVETFLTKTLLFIQRLLPHLKINSSSGFVHISSRSAIFPSRDILYSAVKGGLNAGLRSMTIGLESSKKIFSVAPGLILGSSMANDMPSETRNDHLRRSREELLNVGEFSSELLRLLAEMDKYETGSIIEIGPSYK